MLEKKVYAKSTGDFLPVPMGVYTVLIADVNMVKSFNSFKGIEEEKLNYTLIILDDVKMNGGTTRGRYLFKRCSNSLNEKAWLYKLVKAALARNLTKTESDNFDVESIIGKQVKVMVDQKPSEKDGVIWNNVLSFSPADTQLEPVEYKAKSAVTETSTRPVEVQNEEIDPDALIKKLEEESSK
jgi:hypothetical protein